MRVGKSLGRQVSRSRPHRVEDGDGSDTGLEKLLAAMNLSAHPDRSITRYQLELMLVKLYNMLRLVEARRGS